MIFLKEGDELLSTSLVRMRLTSELVPENHLVRVVNAVIDRLDISEHIVAAVTVPMCAKRRGSFLRFICSVHDWENHCRMLPEHFGSNIPIIDHFYEFGKFS